MQQAINQLTLLFVDSKESNESTARSTAGRARPPSDDEYYLYTNNI